MHFCEFFLQFEIYRSIDLPRKIYLFICLDCPLLVLLLTLYLPIRCVIHSVLSAVVNEW
jgi:hypothetical protein